MRWFGLRDRNGSVKHRGACLPLKVSDELLLVVK
jgi:hypothetical protein